MLACSVFKKCLTIPRTIFSDYTVIAKLAKISMHNNSDTKVSQNASTYT